MNELVSVRVGEAVENAHERAMTNETLDGDASTELRSARIDRAGALASGACAVHCATVSLLPSAAAWLGVGFAASAPLEWGLSAVAVACAAAALASGWRRHRATSVAVAFVLGLAGLVTSRILEELRVEGVGTAVGIGGALALVVAHALNYRRSHRVGRERLTRRA